MVNEPVQLLSITLLQPNPFQPRDKMDKVELQELSDSIKTYGVLEPLVVAHTPAGYQIIAGERRWRAAQLAGLKEVPVIIRKTTPKGMLEMAIVENVQRVDLSPIERGQAFQQLSRDFGFSRTQIAQRIHKSESYVSNSTRLLTLPDAIKDGLVGGHISEGHARALISIQNQHDMIKAYKQILKENGSVRRAEELARIYNEEGSPYGRHLEKKHYSVQDEIIQSWQKDLKKKLKTSSNVKIHRSQRQTRVTIVLKGDQEKTQKDLEFLMKLGDIE